MAESSPEWQMAWRFSKGVWRKIARSWARYLVGFLRYGSIPFLMSVGLQYSALAGGDDLRMIPIVGLLKSLLLSFFLVSWIRHILSSDGFVVSGPAIAADADHSIWSLLCERSRELAGNGHECLFVLAGPAILLSFAAYYGMEVDESSNFGLVIASNGVEYLLYAWNGACLALAYRELTRRQEAMEHDG